MKSLSFSRFELRIRVSPSLSLTSTRVQQTSWSMDTKTLQWNDRPELTRPTSATSLSSSDSHRFPPAPGEVAFGACPRVACRREKSPARNHEKTRHAYAHIQMNRCTEKRQTKRRRDKEAKRQRDRRRGRRDNGDDKTCRRATTRQRSIEGEERIGGGGGLATWMKEKWSL